MSLKPLNELKRRLADDSTPLPKRLCLAKNLVQSHHFPSAPKERVVADWLGELSHSKKLSDEELKNCINWLNADELTAELKACLIQVVSQYLREKPVQDNSVEYLTMFLDHSELSTQLSQKTDEYLHIVITLLKHLKDIETNNRTSLCQKIFRNLIKNYKECKKKLEFIMKLLEGENIETIFDFLHTEHSDIVINICQNILFSMNKKSFFVSFLQTLIRKDNIDELIAEKGDNIQSILKIMGSFFTFPKSRTAKDQRYLTDFINVFVACFKSESQLIFTFYIMVVNSLNMQQGYLTPAMTMPPIIFEENDEKIKRSIFLKMLEILLQYEVNITVRLTDTFGEKVSKVEIKKNFTSFLQNVLLGQLKLEGKLDKNTIQIIKVALKLDPMLIEQKMSVILPPIMTAKKSSNVSECYVEMLNCLLETLFKLSKGTLFISDILPHIKVCLEALNTNQFELKQKIKECIDNGTDYQKLEGKLITGYDVFPEECVEMYGKCTSELMFRQNKDVLLSLQKDFEEHCLMMLEEGFVSPSIIITAQVQSAILSSFMRHNKMADHTVPRQIAEDFWNAFGTFEIECLKKYGECVLKLSYDSTLMISFLNLCQSVAQLKVLNMKYSNVKLDSSNSECSDVFDLSVLLPCLNGKQWKKLAGKVEGDASAILDNVLVLKLIAINMQANRTLTNDENHTLSTTKSHLINQLSINPQIMINNPYVARVICKDLDKSESKILAKSLVKIRLSDNDLESIFTSDAITNNISLLNAIVVEVAKNLTKAFDNIEDLTKALNKTDFDLVNFLKDRNVKEYFNEITAKDNDENLSACVEIFKQLPIECLDEQHQLIAIFVLLITKKNTKTKKLKKHIDSLLRKIYEMSPKYPDLYKIFPVDFLFSFKDRTMIDLLTLKIKTSNNTLIIKCILESAVKKVKTEPEIVKEIVHRLLTNQPSKEDISSSIEYFSDPVFQISCIILPIIAKERKAITVSAYRSILATLQEKIHKSMLECFKNMDVGHNSSLLNKTVGNIDDSVDSQNTLATLNAVGAYSLTLSKYCGTTDADEVKNLDCLWSGLEFFVQNAIQSIQSASTKQQYVITSTQLLNVVLRNFKKLEPHTMFHEKDELFKQTWSSLVDRLLLIFQKESERNEGCLEDIGGVVKFLCELSSVECFTTLFVSDLCKLGELKKPSQITKSDETPCPLTKHKVAHYLWGQCLKANIVGPKCLALTKLNYKCCKELRFWIQQYFETNYDGVIIRKERKIQHNDEEAEQTDELKIVKIDDQICELIKVDLDTIAEAIMAGKKISLDHKSLDAIFSLQSVVLCSGHNTARRLSFDAYFMLFHGCLAVLNSLLVTREQLLEDRWPCYMQCYRSLVRGLCEWASDEKIERPVEEKLGESAHCLEKLTRSLSKRKSHLSRIASYAVADICSLLERHPPSWIVRQHLENGGCLLLQSCDWSQASGFLRRALADTPGHVTAGKLYAAYKRHHKYVGDA